MTDLENEAKHWKRNVVILEQEIQSLSSNLDVLRGKWINFSETILVLVLSNGILFSCLKSRCLVSPNIPTIGNKFVSNRCNTDIRTFVKGKIKFEIESIEILPSFLVPDEVTHHKNELLASKKRLLHVEKEKDAYKTDAGTKYFPHNRSRIVNKMMQLHFNLISSFQWDIFLQ